MKNLLILCNTPSYNEEPMSIALYRRDYIRILLRETQVLLRQCNTDLIVVDNILIDKISNMHRNITYDTSIPFNTTKNTTYGTSFDTRLELAHNHVIHYSNDILKMKADIGILKENYDKIIIVLPDKLPDNVLELPRMENLNIYAPLDHDVERINNIPYYYLQHLDKTNDAWGLMDLLPYICQKEKLIPTGSIPSIFHSCHKAKDLYIEVANRIDWESRDYTYIVHARRVLSIIIRSAPAIQALASSPFEPLRGPIERIYRTMSCKDVVFCKVKRM